MRWPIACLGSMLVVGAVLAEPPAGARWQMVFEDTFDGTSLNWDVWASQAGPSGHILSSRWPENVEVKDGTLRLIARREERGGQSWTAGNVWVKSRNFGYGYFEARYRYGAAPGLNNSFWLFQDVPHKSPGMTEIDINEGHYPDEVNTNLHYHSDGPDKRHFGTGLAHRLEGSDLSREWRVYGLQWTPETLTYYVDGQVIRRLPHRIAYSQDMRLYFSLAVVDWAGTPNDATHGAYQEIDWVRVWEPADPGRFAPDHAPSVLAGVPLPANLPALLDERFEKVQATPWPAARGDQPSLISTSGLPVWRLVRTGDLVVGQAGTAESPPARVGTRCLRLPPDPAVVLIPFGQPLQEAQVSFDLLRPSPWCQVTIALADSTLTADTVAASQWGWVNATGPYFNVFEGGYLRGYDTAWRELGLLPTGDWQRFVIRASAAQQRYDLMAEADGKISLLGNLPFRSEISDLAYLVIARRADTYEPQPAFLDNVLVRGR